MRQRPFYGWVIVGTLSMIGALTMSMGTVSMGLFIAPMSESLGIGRFFFGMANTMKTAGTALGAPLIGRILDKHGSRIPLAVAGITMGTCLVALSLVQHPWQMIIILTVMGFIGLQGGLSLYSQVPISQWFIEKRGKALSWAFIGGPIALLASLPLTAWLLETVGWRTTWVILGLSGGFAITVLSLIFLRKNPESVGLLPDGVEATGNEPQTDSGIPYEYAWTRSQALRHPSFWMLSLGFGGGFFGAGSFVAFRLDYFPDEGISPLLTSIGVALDPLIVVFVTLAIAPILDRISLRHVGSIGIGILTCSLLIAAAAPTVFGLFAANTVFGLGMGMNIAAQNAIWPKYFGRRNIGSIRGISSTVTLLVSAIGGPIVGLIRDESGAYTIAWVLGAIPMLLGAVSVLLARRPEPPTGEDYPMKSSRAHKNYLDVHEYRVEIKDGY